MSNRITGTVKFFNKDKGYGFIKPDNGEKDVFVHYSAIVGSGYRNLEENQRVEFGTEMGDKGIRAIEVKSAEGTPATEDSPEDSLAEESLADS